MIVGRFPVMLRAFVDAATKNPKHPLTAQINKTLKAMK